MTALSRQNLSTINADIAALNQATAKSTQDQNGLKQKLDRLLGGNTLADVDIDLKGDFDAALKAEQTTQENVAKLVFGLNAANQGLVDQFRSMSTDTFIEKVIGLFSKERAQIMKTERIRKASISENLQEMVNAADRLQVPMKERLVALEYRYENTLVGQKRVNEKFELGEQERVTLSAEIERLTAERNALQATIAGMGTETPSSERAALETDFAEISNTFNKATERLQTCIATQQKLAGHRESYANHAYSLAMLIATQKTNIAGLEIDVEETTTMFGAMPDAIKAAKQQEYAAQINLANRVAHSMANDLILQISTSARNSVLSSINVDKFFADNSQKYRELRKQNEANFAKQMADLQAEFERRSASVN